MCDVARGNVRPAFAARHQIMAMVTLPTMKLFAHVLLIVVLFVARTHFSRHPRDDEIRAVLQAQAGAWNRGDIDGYMNGYARGNSTEFLSGDTLTRGWKTVRIVMRRNTTAAKRWGGYRSARSR